MDQSEYSEGLKQEIDELYLDDQVDYYKSVRDSFLKSKYTDYPNDVYEQCTITFAISVAVKNAPLVYSILERMPDDLYITEAGRVKVILPNEDAFFNSIQIIYDLLSVAGSWKSFVLSYNGIELTRTEFGYVADHIFERRGERPRYYNRRVDELKKHYLKGKRSTANNNTPIERVYISRDNPFKSLRSVVDKYTNIYAQNMDVCEHKISDYDVVLNVEDDLIIDFRLMPRYWTRFDDENFKDWDYPYIVIQELTHNDLYKFNFAGFKRCFQRDYIGIDFCKYAGQHYYVKEIDNYDAVDKALPELELQRRYQEYGGETYHLLLFRMVDVAGNAEYGVGYTKGMVHSFVLKLCKELEEKNSRSLELNGASCLPFSENKNFIRAFLSWKGEKKRWRLENKFAYYYEDCQIKEESQLFMLPKDLLSEAYSGKYNGCEFGNYSKPLNRWKSEELVFNLTKKLYKDYQVIYQYRPHYLQTESGSMSYDVYICGLKIAIEYQGKQHFEPVDYFGGRENFEKQQKRDKLKAELSAKNGVKLVFINYWENITPALIRSKIEENK